MIISRAQRWTRLGILVWAFVGLPAANADVLFDYTSDSSGYWYEGANWSQGFAPNGVLDVVTIDRPTADPTVTYTGTSGTSQIKSLTSSEAIVLSGGTLEILDFANLSGSFSLTGGTLRGGLITTTAGLDVNTSSGNTLEGLTLAGDLKLEHHHDQILIRGGLALDGTIAATGKDAYLYFEGTQTLSEISGGTATVSLAGGHTPPDYGHLYATGGGVLTIGAGVTVEGEGYFQSAGGSAIHNEGTIHANQTGTLTIAPETFVNEVGGTLQIDSGAGLSLAATSWDNQGTLNLSGGALTLGSDFTTANINQPSFTRTAGSTVTLSGNLDNTGAVLDAIGEIHLSGGSITGGTSQVDIHASSNSSEVLEGLTLEGDLKLEHHHDQILIRGGLALDGTIAATGKDAYLYFEGPQTLSDLSGGTATVSLAGGHTPSDYGRLYATGGGVLTIGAGVTVEGEGYLMSAGGSAIHNEGTIHANQTGTLTIAPETFVNEVGGTLQIDSGAGLSLAATSWDNQGTLNLSGGALTLGSDFTTANINQPSFTRTAGSTVTLSGNLDNTGAVLDAIGEIHLSGGSITGGTSQVDIHASSNSSEVLEGLTLEGDLKLEHHHDQILIRGGLALDGTIAATGKDAYLYFEGPQTLSDLSGGTATVSLAGGHTPSDYGRLYATGGGVLTIGAGVTVEGEGYLMSAGGSAIHNEGTIHANQTGTLTIAPETFVNEVGGTLQIDSGAGLSLAATSWDNQGTLNLSGGALTLGSDFTTANINQPSFTRTAGSTVTLSGNLDNTGAVLDAIGEIHLSGGSITGGTSQVDIHASSNSSEVLEGLTLEGDLKLEHHHDQILIRGGLALDGTIAATGKDAYLYFEGPQTLSDLSGGTATVSLAGGHTPSDYGRLYATGGGVLTIGAGVTVEGEGYLMSAGGSAIHNEGTIHANQTGTLTIAPETFVNKVGGTLQIDSGAGLSLAATSWDNQGTLNLSGGALTLGSDFTTANINQPSFTRTAGSTVTLSGNLDNTGAVLDAIGEIHLSGGSITGGTSQVDIHASSNSSEVLEGLTLAGDLKLEHHHDQILIRGGLALDGTIAATGKDAYLYFEGPQTLSDLSGGTATVSLAGGHTPSDYGRLYATGGGVLTIGAGVTVEGEGYLMSAGGSAIHNEGTIHANQTGTLYITPETFVNEVGGTLQVSGGSGLSLAATLFENHGAIELTDGGLLYTSGLGAAGLELTLGSSLRGEGTVSGSVTNSAGSLSPDAILLSGDYTQGAAGELFVGIGGLVQGVEYDFLDVSGVATLAGSLRLELEDGFLPSVTDSFVILEAAGGLSGTFDSVVSTDGSVWSLDYQPTQVILSFEQLVVPEPATLLTLLLGSLTLLLFRRRR